MSTQSHRLAISDEADSDQFTSQTKKLITNPHIQMKMVEVSTMMEERGGCNENGGGLEVILKVDERMYASTLNKPTTV